MQNLSLTKNSTKPPYHFSLDTVSLLFTLKDGGLQLQEIFQVIEFQLFMVILIAVGVTSATIILISYTLFWAMKLTGETILLKS